MSQTLQESNTDFFDRIKYFILLLRPLHWVKAIFVLLGCLYAKAIGYWPLAFMAAASFCFISSAVYIYNDIEDRTEDSLHPRKCNRPLASDKVSVYEAITLLFLLLATGLSLSFYISAELGFIVTLYLLLNVAYNHVLKLLPVLDVLCIASGFMLRTLAGTVGIGLPMSLWLTVAATLLSLFIALNKRQFELKLNASHQTRQVLNQYREHALKKSIIGVGIFSFLTYLFYILYVHEESFYFILTIPFAAIGLWRFYWLGTGDVDNDDPVSVFLSDRLSRVILYCFASLTLTALL